MALDLTLPRQVLTHAHWTLGHEKMSKSTGNVVNPFFALDRFGVDTMRYYLAHDGGIQDDADYANEFIIERYKKGLQRGLGNLTSRVMRGRGWDVRRAIVSSTNDHIPTKGEEHTKHRELISSIPQEVTMMMESLNVGSALKSIMAVVYKVSPRNQAVRKLDLPIPFQTNQYMQYCEPWILTSSKDPESIAELDSIIYTCAEALRVCGILLQPFMPSKMSRLLDILGVRPEARGFSNASLGSDADYGTPSVKLGRGHARVLFPPLRSDD